jgi:hypothetical protein
MKEPPEGNPLVRQLKVSDRLFGKLWLLSRTARYLGIAAVVAIVAALGLCLESIWSRQAPSFSWGELILIVGALLLGAVLFDRLSGFLNYRKTLDQILIGLTLTVGALVAKLHLYVFDKIFLRQGSIEHLLKDSRR